MTDVDMQLETVDAEDLTECGTYTVFDYLDDEYIERCVSCWRPVDRS